MNFPHRALATLLLTAPLMAQASPLQLPPAQGSVRFSQIKTSEVTTLDRLTHSGGSWFRTVRVNHTAVLVEHPRGRFLFDTGLGTQVDRQFGEEMPWWAKPLFAYGPVTPARAQLQAAQLPPVDRIILSHGHWDHASALVDFPGAAVWVTAPERRFLASAAPPAVLPSQVNSPAIRWHVYDFEARPYAGYPRSLDPFGDGSAVLVPMPGHTPGAAGLFLTLTSGRRAFFTGDTVWRLASVAQADDKFWLASRFVDADRSETHRAIEQLRAVMQANPGLLMIPAHDTAVQDPLGYFPGWVQ